MADVVKINTDVAICVKDGSLSIRFITRNHKGLLIAAPALPIYSASDTEFESLAILEAVKWATALEKNQARNGFRAAL